MQYTSTTPGKPVMSDGIEIFERKADRPNAAGQIGVRLVGWEPAKAIHKPRVSSRPWRLKATKAELARQEQLRHLQVNADFLATQQAAMERFQRGAIDNAQYRQIVREARTLRDARLGIAVA